MFKLDPSSGSLPKISLETWHHFETFFENQRPTNPSLGAYEKSELCLRVINLWATLFNDQTLSFNHSFEFLAAIIPMLHCICSALYVREGQYLLRGF
jgi:hypothetical protein